MYVRVQAFAWSLSLVAGSCMAANYTVHLNDEFPPTHMTPNEITIAVGDTVTFISDRNSERHNVHAYDDSFRCSAGCRGDGSGVTGSPALNWQSTVRFTRLGTVQYGCDAHYGTMHGAPALIHVVENAPAFDSDQVGLSGSWVNPAADSQGLMFDVVPDFPHAGHAYAFGGWFTYDTQVAGGLRWYTVQGELGAGPRSTVPIYESVGGRFDSAQQATLREVGTASLGFDDCRHGGFDYRFGDGRSGSIPLTRLLANVGCRDRAGSTATPDAPIAALSGAWADPSNASQGLVLEINPVQQVAFAAWYTFRPDGDPGSGPAGQDWYTLQGAAPRGADALHDIGIYETSGGVFDRHADTTTRQVGSADLTLHDCTSATLAYRFTAGRNAGRDGTLDLRRVTPAPATCALWP